ncbi:MAG: 50S ribosomal protein L28 [Rhodospirillaceae bacterium]|nr:50S ribosomal protein L28 [Rhodospirillaceae bacterium]
MARRCVVTGKGVLSGNNVSHANNKTKRRYLPNLQIASLVSDALGQSVRLRLTTRGIRTVEKNGGLDMWLLSRSDADLHDEIRRLKRRVEKALAKKSAAAA